MEIPRTLKLVYVEWDDADAISRWMSTEEVATYVDSVNPVRQAGFLIHEDDHVLVLAGQMLNADDFGDEKFGNLMRIPKPWIHRRIVLMTVALDGTIKRK